MLAAVLLGVFWTGLAAAGFWLSVPWGLLCLAVASLVVSLVVGWQ